MKPPTPLTRDDFREFVQRALYGPLPEPRVDYYTQAEWNDLAEYLSGPPPREIVIPIPDCVELRPLRWRT